MRITHKLSDNELIHKKDIIEAIQRFPQDLREYVVVGRNKFDIDCLKILVAKTPRLTKLNYLWNFEEDGFRLHEEQIFSQAQHFMDKPLDSTPELFNLLGELKEL